MQMLYCIFDGILSDFDIANLLDQISYDNNFIFWYIMLARKLKIVPDIKFEFEFNFLIDNVDYYFIVIFCYINNTKSNLKVALFDTLKILMIILLQNH